MNTRPRSSREELLRRHRERAARYRRKNAERVKQNRRAAFVRNYAHCSALAAQQTRLATEALKDCYVRGILSRDSKVPPKAWPSWVVDLKRLAIQLKRKHGLSQGNRRRTQ